MAKRTFKIYRYDPDKDAKPYMQTIEVELDGHERMLLEELVERVRAGDLAVQPFLVPAVIELPAADVDALLNA